MRVYFNDLTLAPTPEKNGVFLRALLGLKKEFFSDLKARGKDPGGLLIVNDEGLERLIAAFECHPELKPFLFSCFGRGYQEDVEKDADHLLETEYTIQGPDQQMLVCAMMGLAQKENSVTLGMDANPFWQQLVYTIHKETVDGSASDVEALCVTHRRQLNSVPVLDQVNKSDCFRSETHKIEKSSSKKRIVVLGVHDRGVLVEVLRNLHIDPSRFDFIETGDVANYNCTRWRNSTSIAALMVGAVPHSAAGMGEATSVLDAMKKQPGYPHVEELTETMEAKIDVTTGATYYKPAGELNVTKQSFRCGLMNLMNKGLI